MFFSASTLDDLLHKVIERLLQSKNRIKPARARVTPQREATEEIGILLQLSNPRARLSRTEKKGSLFSCLGEFLWYMSGRNDLDFIQYYIRGYGEDSEDGKTIYGGYGPRLFQKGGTNQILNVLTQLRDRPDSRRAVIQLFDAEDLASPHREIPCTCTLQFMRRKNKLHMIAHMRSNDAFLGLPHDIFCFTMLQELFARTLEIELGIYKHSIGSLHLYEKDRKNAEAFLSEGFQEEVPMPAMPVESPWPFLLKLLYFESRLRRGHTAAPPPDFSPYWADLFRVLQIFRHYKDRKPQEITKARELMQSRIFDSYIDDKQRKVQSKSTDFEPTQHELPLGTST